MRSDKNLFSSTSDSEELQLVVYSLWTYSFAFNTNNTGSGGAVELQIQILVMKTPMFKIFVLVIYSTPYIEELHWFRRFTHATPRKVVFSGCTRFGKAGKPIQCMAGLEPAISRLGTSQKL